MEFNLRPFVSFVTCVALTGSADSREFVVRQTIYGEIRGYVNTVLENMRVERFLGIPFAAPPTGELRFEYPQEPAAWSDIVNTTELPPACPQTMFEWSYIKVHVPDFERSSEDCLYMNIYVPQSFNTDDDSHDDKAVLVHVHGGSNEVGMSGMFHGDVLAAMGDIIVVTFNYRLGPFGFLSGASPDFPGNYGLFDQTLALRWVKKNIHFFGGDPEKVTVEGHSAGAGDVGLHILSPKSKGMFRYAIMQSGSPTAFWAYVRPTRNIVPPTLAFAAEFGCSDIKDMGRVKQCLKSVHSDKIIGHPYQFVAGMFNYAPVIDEMFLHDTPENLITHASLNGDAYMTGLTRNEGSLTAEVVVNELHFTKLTPMFARTLTPLVTESKHSRELIEVVVHEYTPWSDPGNETANIISLSRFVGDSTFVAPAIDVATRIANRNKEIYFYNFEYHSPLSPPPSWLGVPHGRDQFYLFGCPFSGHPLYNYTDEDRQVSKTFIDMWSNFVKFGKPLFSSFQSKTVPRFAAKDQLYVRISGHDGNATVSIGSRLRAKQVNFWNSLLPSIEFGRHNTEPLVGTVAWVFIALTICFFVFTIILIGCVIHFKKKSCDVL